jgi:hypothetical protein
MNGVVLFIVIDRNVLNEWCGVVLFIVIDRNVLNEWCGVVYCD